MSSDLHRLRAALAEEQASHQEHLQQLCQEHRASKALMKKDMQLTMDSATQGIQQQLQVCMLVRVLESVRFPPCYSIPACLLVDLLGDRSTAGSAWTLCDAKPPGVKLAGGAGMQAVLP